MGEQFQRTETGDAALGRHGAEVDHSDFGYRGGRVGTAGGKQTRMGLPVVVLIRPGDDGQGILPIELFLRERESIPSRCLAYPGGADGVSRQPGGVASQNTSLKRSFVLLFRFLFRREL